MFFSVGCLWSIRFIEYDPSTSYKGFMELHSSTTNVPNDHGIEYMDDFISSSNSTDSGLENGTDYPLFTSPISIGSMNYLIYSFEFIVCNMLLSMFGLHVLLNRKGRGAMHSDIRAALMKQQFVGFNELYSAGLHTLV